MSAKFEPGAVLDGKYRIIRRIGAGGMGTVYEGENVRIQRRVAIKVLDVDISAAPELADRFDREARAAVQIGSPYVCDVIDSGDLATGERFIVMEYLEGENLAARLTRGPMKVGELAPIAFELLEGLRTMHAAGVIHRDLKPANVFLVRRAARDTTETVKILDFGVAKLLSGDGDVTRMTATGIMIGTPTFMSPEQARGLKTIDGRTDIYSASVMFYKALTGQLPHTAESLHDLLFKIVLEQPKPIVELAPGTDAAFAAIVMKGLSRTVDDRYSSARAYQEAIARWGRDQGAPALAFALQDSSPHSIPPPSQGLDPDPQPTPTPIMGGLGTVGLPVPVARSAHAHAHAGATLVMTNAPLTPAHSGGHEVAVPPPPRQAPAFSRGLVVAGVGVVAVVLATGYLAARYGSSSRAAARATSEVIQQKAASPAPPPPLKPSAIAPDAPPPSPPPPPPVAITAAAASVPSALPSASPPVVTATAPLPKPRFAAPAAPPPKAAPPPPPTASADNGTAVVSGRKFRTTLD